MIIIGRRFDQIDHGNATERSNRALWASEYVQTFESRVRNFPEGTKYVRGTEDFARMTDSLAVDSHLARATLVVLDSNASHAEPRTKGQFHISTVLDCHQGFLTLILYGTSVLTFNSSLSRWIV